MFLAARDLGFRIGDWGVYGIFLVFGTVLVVVC
jgi:hypothetical protein